MKKIFILFIILLCSLSGQADDGVYVEVEASYHDERSARPEVNLQTPLGSVELGYQNADDWTVGARHTSSIPGREVGDGINELFISKRIWIK